MVWKNFKKKINNKKIKTIIEAKVARDSKLSYSEFLLKKLSKKSGVMHDINTVTGKNIKDAFVDGELKKTYLDKETKRSKRRRHRIGGLEAKFKKMIPYIKDGVRLASYSTDSQNLFSVKKFSDFKKERHTPTLYYKKWTAMQCGTLVDKKQATYLQSKKDIVWESYKKEVKEFTNSVAGVTNKLIWLDIFSEKMLHMKRDQDSEHFNHFIRYYNYKNLLFRSFWFNKFVSTLVKCGKKLKVWGYVIRGFSFLKSEFGRNPVVLLFEILELYRMPIRGLAPKSTTRKSVIRTHLVPWWKQYTQILRWVRHALTGAVKNHESWNKRVRVELLNLMTENSASLVKKRIESNFQLIAFGKIAIHFRWHKRYSKRTVKSIRILDKQLLEG